jgi:hypothetical protein
MTKQIEVNEWHWYKILYTPGPNEGNAENYSPLKVVARAMANQLGFHAAGKWLPMGQCEVLGWMADPFRPQTEAMKEAEAGRLSTQFEPLPRVEYNQDSFPEPTPMVFTLPGDPPVPPYNLVNVKPESVIFRSQSEYLNSYGHCPACSSEQLDGGFIQVEEDYCTQSVQCCDCSAEWIDQYKLSGYSPTKDPVPKLPLPTIEKAMPILRVNAPGWYDDNDFVHWLNSKGVATWHLANGHEGEPHEYSDVFTLYGGPNEGSDYPNGIPWWAWNELRALVQEKFGTEEIQCLVWISNLDG